MKRKLYTAGYAGLSIEQFVEMLLEHEIECLVDVREIPISRKKGFSKKAMKECMESHRIQYLHLKALGSPRQLRHQVRKDRNYPFFFREVRKHLRTPFAKTSLAQAISTARSLRSCLMCYCPSWEQCHRSCVVDALVSRSYFAVEHLIRHDDQQLQIGKRAA